MGYMAGHQMTQYWQATEVQQNWKTLAPGEEPRTYRMAFPAKVGLQSCPVKGCPGRAATRMVMRVHFLYRNILETVVILEEQNLPHPRCTRCDMLVPHRELNARHTATAQSARGGGGFAPPE